MIKIIPPKAWAFDGPQVEQIKTASTGFRGHDFAEFVKRASHPLADWVRSNPPLPGEVYLHNIALGAGEKVGANRNSDFYSEAMLRRDHPTFEKYARWYMNHCNKDPRKSYGVIKKAYYNEPLGRVEVIAALNATKEAAERNKGLIAERTLSKLASNHDVAVSQSVKVPYDECMACGHKAKNRSEYCTPASMGGSCKYGGCRDNLGRIYDDGMRQCVDNPYGTFFDLSDVSDTRGADRTAFVTGKVAQPECIGGAKMAEALGLVAPDYLLDPNTLGAVRCLRKLASSTYLNVETAPTWDDCIRIRSTQSKSKSASVPYPSEDYERHQLISELGAAGVILPPAHWLSYMTGVHYDKCASLFTDGIDVERDLLNQSDAHDEIANAITPSTDNRLSTMRKWAWLSPTVDAHSAESAIGVLMNTPNKTKSAATTNKVANEAKAAYLAYQGKILAYHENSPNLLLLHMECMRHNRGCTN